MGFLFKASYLYQKQPQKDIGSYFCTSMGLTLFGLQWTIKIFYDVDVKWWVGLPGAKPLSKTTTLAIVKCLPLKIKNYKLQ